MNTLDAVRLYHRRGFNVLPLVAGTKTPPYQFHYKRWFTARQTEHEIGSWFTGDRDIGIILGPVSGGLYVRDFDGVLPFDQWRTNHPDLVLPTVATPRPGSHLYFHNPDRIKTQVFADGELRGHGAYVVAPPSRHPNGGRYAWRVPLGEVIPTVDPATAGLLGEPEKPPAPSHCTDVVSLWVSVSLCASLYNGGLNVEGIAALALPDSPHTNNKLLFMLARICRTIGRLRGQPLGLTELDKVFNCWHRRSAKYLLPDQTRDEYRFEFLRGIASAKYDIGNEPLAVAWERAQRQPLPATAMQFDDPQLRLLVALCAELQRAAGAAPLFLSCRTVARLLKHETHTTAASWLRGLVAAGVLKIVEQGGPATNRATRYRYLPPMEHVAK